MVGSRLRSRRRGGDVSVAPCEALLVIPADTAASAQATAMVRDLVHGGSVAVVLILPIHGYAFGLPNPGLLPNARERSAADQAMHETLRVLEHLGLEVDGEIVVTRNARRAVTRIARRRCARTVLVDQRPVARVRRLLEGDLVGQLSRRLAPAMTVTRV